MNNQVNCKQCGNTINVTSDHAYCKECDDSICPKCGSDNLDIWDDGEGYANNVECKNCGHWLS